MRWHGWGGFYKSINDQMAYILLYDDDIQLARLSEAIYFKIRDSLRSLTS